MITYQNATLIDFRLSADCEYLLQHKYHIQIPSDRTEKDSLEKSLALFLIAESLERQSIFGNPVTFASLDLPEPHIDFDLVLGGNRLMCEEQAYIIKDYTDEWSKMNVDQATAADCISNAVETQTGECFFLDGLGGTGKTYVQSCILKKIRSQSQIALAVASTGIASILLQGGRTAHSRFKIPLNATPQSCCSVKKNTDLALLLQKTVLIFWDEAPMQSRYNIEAVDRMLRDIRGVDHLFGGVTICFCGDFRQCLPVVSSGSQGEIIGRYLRNSYIWEKLSKLQLCINERLQQRDMTESERKEAMEFAQTVLDVGDYTGPDDMVDWHHGHLSENTEDALISVTYPEPNQHLLPDLYFAERIILSTKNVDVSHLNTTVLDKNNSLLGIYASADQVSSPDDACNISVEQMNATEDSGLPPHILKLKVGCLVMLLRNLDYSRGLCNGSRLRIRMMGRRFVECVVLTGEHAGANVILPRIPVQNKDSNSKSIVQFTRRQFPIRLAYAMTINKSQGQSLKYVGINFAREVFSHGQFYVAVSRCTTKHGIKIIVPNTEHARQHKLKNIVWKLPGQ